MTLDPLPAIERILLTLWVGSLWVAGLVVAPLLFAMLDDRALAGTVAGRLFSITSYIGLACGGMLLVLNGWRYRVPNWRAAVLLVMLVLIVIGQFVLAPMIVDLRLQGLTDTVRFGQLHGLAGMVFMVNCVLGLVLVTMGQPRGPQSLRSR
jgi:hypothetical protein